MREEGGMKQMELEECMKKYDCDVSDINETEWELIW